MRVKLYVWQYIEERTCIFGLVEGLQEAFKRTRDCGLFLWKPRYNKPRRAVASWAASWRAGEPLRARSMPIGVYLAVLQGPGCCWDISAAYGIGTRWPPRVLLTLGVTIYGRWDDHMFLLRALFAIQFISKIVLFMFWRDTTHMTCWLPGYVSELFLWCYCG